MLVTDDIQLNELAAVRLRGDLTFVETGIAGLAVLDLQRPVLGRPLADDTEPLIGGVSVAAHRQNVDVAVAYP